MVSAELESTKARLEEVDDVQTIYDIMCYAEKRQAEAMVSPKLHDEVFVLPCVRYYRAFKEGPSMGKLSSTPDVPFVGSMSTARLRRSNRA